MEGAEEGSGRGQGSGLSAGFPAARASTGDANVKRCTPILLVILKITALSTPHGLGKKTWCLCEKRTDFLPHLWCVRCVEGAGAGRKAYE